MFLLVSLQGQKALCYRIEGAQAFTNRIGVT